MSYNLVQHGSIDEIRIACEMLNDRITAGAMCRVRSTISVNKGVLTAKGEPVDQLQITTTILPEIYDDSGERTE